MGSFSERIVADVIELYPTCHLCGKIFGDERGEVHSATSYHLEIYEMEGGGYMYRVTDPPDEYAYMTGQLIDPGEFMFGFRYFADAYHVCRKCHIKIDRRALELSQMIPGFKSTTPTPHSMVAATFEFGLANEPEPIKREFVIVGDKRIRIGEF